MVAARDTTAGSGRQRRMHDDDPIPEYEFRSSGSTRRGTRGVHDVPERSQYRHGSTSHQALGEQQYATQPATPSASLAHNPTRASRDYGGSMRHVTRAVDVENDRSPDEGRSFDPNWRLAAENWLPHGPNHHPNGHPGRRDSG